MKSITSRPISELVESVTTWNPLREKATKKFLYVDLSAVDQELKQITQVREMACADAPSRARQLVRPGDILVSTVRPNLNGVARVPAKLHSATASTGFCVLRPKPTKLDSSYLFHWVKSPQFVSDMVSKATGASYPAVSDRTVLTSHLPFVALSEQRRIASILDQANAICAKRREALDQLDELQQAIFIEMFGDPEANPKGFPMRTLGEIIKFEGGSQPPASTFSSADAPDRIRLVQIRDFKSDRFMTYIPRKLSKRFFEEDDVMIGRYGPPVFQILRGLSGSYNVALIKAVPRNGVTKDFVFHLLKEKRLHNFVVANSERTAGQSGVNLELLEKYSAYLPPMELQIKFLQLMGQLKTLRKAMSAGQNESDSLFASLQHRAFRGEL